jgi:hypothetical protein
MSHPALSKGEGPEKRAKFKSSPCATAKAKAARGWRGLFMFCLIFKGIHACFAV